MGSVKQKIEIEIDVPEGYEVIDFRPPLKDELFLSELFLSNQDFKTVLRATFDFTIPKFIIRKVKRYREPVLPADAGKVVEVMDAKSNWHNAILTGYRKHVYNWLAVIEDRGEMAFQHCRIEVTDEPT